MDESNSDNKVPLSDMIETLREELQTSLEKGAGKAIVFAIDKVELELKVSVGRKVDGKAGVAFWVVTAGGGVQYGSDTVHTFKLTLSPVSAATGARAQVAADAGGQLSSR